MKGLQMAEAPRPDGIPTDEVPRGSGLPRSSIFPTRFAPWQTVPPGTFSLGINAWLWLGIAAAGVIVAWFFAKTAGITIPLIIGGVLGVMFAPLVERMSTHRIPKALGATLVVLLLAIAIGLTIWLTVGGVVDQWPAIQKSLTNGVNTFKTELAQRFGITGETVDQFITQAEKQASTTASSVSGGAVSSVATNVLSGLSSALAFLFGTFLGTVLLFYFLTDWPTMSDWLAGHLGVPKDIGSGIVDDASGAIRGYFQGTTVTGIMVAIVIGATMWLMGIPLAGAVAVVTFLTCYIPFFGAIISGAFAFMITLGTSGFQSAIIVLVVILLAQNLLQTIITNKVMGDALDLHPVVVLVVTIVGGTFAGILGSALAAPVTATAVRVVSRLKKAADDIEAEADLAASPQAE